ncbi:MAG: hypothetical protein ACREQV_12850, partial [Candidatus Binatia bacterium]
MDANQFDINSLNAIKTALDLYFVQYSATDKLWVYFAVVTLGVLGFSVASEKVSRSFLEAAIVAIGYVIFSVGNYQALMAAQKQLIQFAALARRVASQHDVEMPALASFPMAEQSCFYWGVVIAVCAGILLITYRRRI